MNPITLMILTVLANATITGIIGYFIQKKIENSFAKKIEEFRASLQYSIFEQQTKFAKIHPKRVEILENLHQKFILFADTCGKMMHERDIKQQVDVTGKLIGFWEYFVANRLFMPDSLESEIEKIFTEAVELVGRASAVFYNSDERISLDEFFDELNKQTRNIEKLYKSVADPATK
jgi:hypothetical protein